MSSTFYLNNDPRATDYLLEPREERLLATWISTSTPAPTPMRFLLAQLDEFGFYINDDEE
jgi:hypothetical protein